MSRRILFVLALLAFAAFLAWTTVSAQKVECDVCVAFDTGQNCAKATASGEAEAARSAQTTACGPLARGMEASIACGNVRPVKRVCRSRCTARRMRRTRSRNLRARQTI